MSSTQEPLMKRILDVLIQNPWAFLIQLLITICMITQIVTRVSSNLRAAAPKLGTKSIPRLSYWIPYIGNSLVFSFRPQSWLLEVSRNLQSNLFALRLYGHDYIVVTSPALQGLLTTRSAPVSTRDHDDMKSLRFFGNQSVSPGKSDGASKALESYLADSSRMNKLIRTLEAHSYNFISLSKSWVDQAQWERGADINILKEKPLSVSASLTKLARDFSANMIFSSLLGTSFMEANPNFIGDFFSFSSSYSMFMTGLPYYVAPGLGPPALAREKCLLAIDGLLDAMAAELGGNSMSGKGTGMLYDLDDVHPAIWGLVKQASTSSKLEKRGSACEILHVVWNITFASVNIVLWALIYLFEKDGENKSVLEGVKTEIKKMIEVVKPKPTGLPFEDPPRLKFKAFQTPDEVEQQCSTLYNVLQEILRLESEPEEYVTVRDDLVLSVDAAPDPNSTKKPALLSNVVDKFQLKKGDKVYIPYGVTSKDTHYWDRPRRFAPNRYSLVDGTYRRYPEPPKMRSGYQFACLAESMCIVMALLSFYEFEDVKHPGTKMVAGVGIPKGDLKVRISRRKL